MSASTATTRRPAARIAYADGDEEELSFGELSRSTAQFAHLLEEPASKPASRSGIMIDPSPAFYTALFGALKRGAVAVPLYTLFGPDAVRDRLDDCGASLLVADEAAEEVAADLGYRLLRFDPTSSSARPDHYETTTAARDPAVLQYTSGTTRQLAEAVPHDHRSIVTLVRAGLFALGLAPGDRYFCPSSPAWGHGLWHGTIAPWSLGVALGAYSGRFSIDRFVDALRDLQHHQPRRGQHRLPDAAPLRPARRAHRALEKASYTGEELDAERPARLRGRDRRPRLRDVRHDRDRRDPRQLPGLPRLRARPGALGKPLPGLEVAVLTEEGEVAPPGTTGRDQRQAPGAMVRREGPRLGRRRRLLPLRGRADDVIISAGWTISPLEVERALLAHPRVSEAAVIGVPDELRGQVGEGVLVADGGRATTSPISSSRRCAGTSARTSTRA